MNNLSPSMNSSLEWRRSKVQELASQGYNQSEISRILQISQPTINRDLSYLRQQAKDNIKNTLTKDCQKSMRNVLLG
jgi:transcriptional regulator